MIVDDNPEIRMAERLALEKAGHEVLEAAGGEECLGALRRGNNKPDLIILDVMMPRLDGWEVSRTIKSNESLKGIIICMLTAKATLMDALMSMESAGADWHLNKPVSIKTLVKTVNWLLDQKSASPEQLDQSSKAAPQEY
jgi:DNA-binding response OmpR family regulator